MGTFLIQLLISFYHKTKNFIISLYWYNLFCPALYTSIYDTPAYIWEEFHHTKDEKILLDLIKDPNKRNLKWLKGSKIPLLLNALYEDTIVKFPPKEYLKQLALRIKISIYMWKAVHEDKRYLRTRANILKFQLKKPEINKENNFYENCLRMVERLGVPIISREISIFDFNSNLEILSKK